MSEAAPCCDAVPDAGERLDSVLRANLGCVDLTSTISGDSFKVVGQRIESLPLPLTEKRAGFTESKNPVPGLVGDKHRAGAVACNALGLLEHSAPLREKHTGTRKL